MKSSELIKEYRRKSGLTQAELAKKCDVYTQYVSSVESGRIPIGIRAARKFKRVLNIPKTKVTQSLLKDYEDKILRAI